MYGILFPVLVPQLLTTFLSVGICLKAVFHFRLATRLFLPWAVTGEMPRQSLHCSRATRTFYLVIGGLLCHPIFSLCSWTHLNTWSPFCILSRQQLAPHHWHHQHSPLWQSQNWHHDCLKNLMDQFYSCHLPYAINSKQQLQHKAGTAIQLELSGTIHHEDAKTDERIISGWLLFDAA